MFRDQKRYGRDPSTVLRAADPTFFAPLRARRWAEQRLAIKREQHRRMRVFTCSWSDFFHPDADPWRDEAWSLIRDCPQYDWQILTKRPELIADRLPEDWGEGWPHVWLGVSIENRRYIPRAEQLRLTPAAVRFISAEPLLGPLVYPYSAHRDESGWYRPASGQQGPWGDASTLPALSLDYVDWLIVGGESGPGHRRIDPNWVRDLQLVASESGTAFFFKQWGGPKPTSGGRLLDGRTWSEFPVSPVAGIRE